MAGSGGPAAVRFCPPPPALARGAACLSLSQTRLVSSPHQKTLKASFIIALFQRGKMKRLKTMK